MTDKIPLDWQIIDSTNVDKPGRVEIRPNPYAEPQQGGNSIKGNASGIRVQFESKQAHTMARLGRRLKTVVRLPSYDMVRQDPVLYAHANRVLHLETNPGNARALVQNQGGRKGVIQTDGK